LIKRSPTNLVFETPAGGLQGLRRPIETALLPGTGRDLFPARIEVKATSPFLQS
jgi:hypothetical protein